MKVQQASSLELALELERRSHSEGLAQEVMEVLERVLAYGEDEESEED